jgi:ABC-2 type transport system ATP-binding protein
VSHAHPALEVIGLRYAFKKHVAVEDVSFHVERQSIHGFVGPNGAGKTTTLKVIATLLRPQIGAVRVFGQDVMHQTQQVRRRLGFMPDHFSLYRQMTVFEYLDFFAAAYGQPVSQRNKTIADVLALTDMEVRKDDLIKGLSRGMQQRVSLARVLVHDPDLLLLDEPASGLDPRARIELMEILRELSRMGKTIFVSSHILAELAMLCDAVTIIDRGRIKYSGPMGHLLEHQPAGTEGGISYELLLAEPVAGLEQRLSALAGVTEVSVTEGQPRYTITFDPQLTSANAILRGLLANDGEAHIIAFNRVRRHLDQAFMDLTEPGVRA